MGFIVSIVCDSGAAGIGPGTNVDQDDLELLCGSPYSRTLLTQCPVRKATSTVCIARGIKSVIVWQQLTAVAVNNPVQRPTKRDSCADGYKWSVVV